MNGISVIAKVDDEYLNLNSYDFVKYKNYNKVSKYDVQQYNFYEAYYDGKKYVIQSPKSLNIDSIDNNDKLPVIVGHPLD